MDHPMLVCLVVFFTFDNMKRRNTLPGCKLKSLAEEKVSRGEKPKMIDKQYPIYLLHVLQSQIRHDTELYIQAHINICNVTMFLLFIVIFA